MVKADGDGEAAQVRSEGTAPPGEPPTPPWDGSFDEDDEEEQRSEPSSDRWNSRPDTGRWLAAGRVADADPEVRYLIRGWLAERGTSVWFGAGSTGKTQLMLWMAAMLASQPEDRPETTWLGGRIEGGGHVLILTAEDTGDQIVGRLKDVLTHTMRQGAEARLRTGARLHVMPFLSMRQNEFRHDNPSLFEQDARERTWHPSEVMKEVRRYIAEWNRGKDRPEDRIIGIVMDSATSMSGFDSLDAQATTNFFFYLGRMCERLRIFWAVIGHTPKATTVSRDTYRATAPSRLRGVAMWTTAPRLTVEVRLVQDWSVRGRRVPEANDIRVWLDGRVERRDLLVVYVAKANLKHASQEERYLARQERGAFVDVTDRPEHVLRSGVLDRTTRRAVANDNRSAASASAHAAAARPTDAVDAPVRRGGGRKPLDPTRFAPATDYLLELIRETYASVDADQIVSGNRLLKIALSRRAVEPRARLIGWPSGAGDGARPGGVSWHLHALATRGDLLKGEGGYVLPAQGTSGVPDGTAVRD